MRDAGRMTYVACGCEEVRRHHSKQCERHAHAVRNQHNTPASTRQRRLVSREFDEAAAVVKLRSQLRPKVKDAGAAQPQCGPQQTATGVLC